MFCIKCGQETEEDRFCSGCGTQVDSQNETANTSQAHGVGGQDVINKPQIQNGLYKWQKTVIWQGSWVVFGIIQIILYFKGGDFGPPLVGVGEKLAWVLVTAAGMVVWALISWVVFILMNRQK